MKVASVNKMFFGIVVNIAIFFIGSMMYIYLGEWIGNLGFFGDVPCAHCGVDGNPGIIWGIRHYLYLWMSLALGFANIVRIVLVALAYMEEDPEWF
jgi:hypothetical protein